MMAEQPKAPRREEGDSDLAFSIGLGDLLNLFFLFRDNLVWHFSTAKYRLIIRNSENTENQKNEDNFLQFPKEKHVGVFPPSSFSKIKKDRYISSLSVYLPTHLPI